MEICVSEGREESGGEKRERLKIMGKRMGKKENKGKDEIMNTNTRVTYGVAGLEKRNVCSSSLKR